MKRLVTSLCIILFLVSLSAAGYAEAPAYPDNKVITVPNSAFSKSPYLNFTTNDTRRVDLKINISYQHDLEHVTPHLLKAAGSLPWARSTPKPKILIKELSDVGLKATLSVWTNKPQKIAEYKTQLAQRVKGILVEGLEEKQDN